MSYDEFPPEPAAPSTEEAAPHPAPGTSAQDAPPAPASQRRRAKAAGTDAASDTAPSTSEKPVRASRPRRKTAASADAAADGTSPVVSEGADVGVREGAASSAPTAAPSSAPPAPADATPSAKASSRPSRRKSARRPAESAPPSEGAASNAPTAAPSSAPTVVAGIAPETAKAEAPSSAKSRGRRSRKGAAAGGEQIAEGRAESAPPPPEAAPPTEAPSTPRTRHRGRSPQTLPVEAAAPEPPVAAAEAVAAPTESAEAPPRSRSRRTRGRKAAEEKPAPTETDGQAVTAPPEPVSEAPATGVKRPSRSRRGQRAAPTETEAPTTSPSAPPVESAEAPTAPSRSRRSRRGGRNRRGAAISEGAERATDGQVTATVEAPPLPAVDLTVGAHLVPRHGLPEIHIYGKVYPPVLFFGNMEGAHNQQRVLSEVRRAARAGIHLHSTLIELPCPLSEATDALDEIDGRLRALLDADPDGYVMPRIVFLPARGWKREYPTEIATYADGMTGDPSITSVRFWQEAERSLATLIAHLSASEWGRRVFGYHLERGEWFQPADLGYDRSIANRDAFRDWLREKYRNNLVALRAAWYDGDVQFHTAEIPPLPTKPNPQRAFFETRRERRTIDFYAFTSESTAQRLIALAHAVKKAANSQALVSVCYGYTFEFGHPYSGHLALGTLLASPTIDLVCGPPSYRDRKPGGAASYPAPVDSPPLHGKLWLSEDDTKTYLAPPEQDPDDFNPRLHDRFHTEQAQARALGRSLAHTTAIGFMDLWGEGWLDDDSLWERLGSFTARYATILEQRDHPRVPEVVALIDEKSLLHVQRGEAFFRKLTNGLRDVLQRAGISYGTYLQSDLLSPDFPTGAKLYLFLTPYRLNAEQRGAIKEKLQRDNKTLAWLYAPGACEERPTVGGMMEEAATGATGMILRPQEWNSEIGSRVIEPHHLVTERLAGREIGTRERLNPSFYVEDAGATVLAEYQGSGLASLAVKNCGSWKSVFVGDPVLPIELLRGICRYAGVHVWTPQGEDLVSLGNGWVTIHASRDGQRTLRLPEPAGVYDLFERRLVADETREYRFSLRSGMTRVFGVGSVERFARLGLLNLTLADNGHARISVEPPPMAPPPMTPTPVTPAPVPLATDADRETLEAVLNLDLSAIDEADIELLDAEALEYAADPDLPRRREALPPALEAATSGEFIANGRRRRRRGGRGRGRRRPGADSGESLETPPADAAETTASLPNEIAALPATEEERDTGFDFFLPFSEGETE